MKNKYKKLLYLLGLTSMLSLNACDRGSEKIESQKECLENHLDEEKIQILELSDGSKYVKETDILTSIREQFLKNNQILNLENINIENEYFEQLVNETDYMYMYENSEIRKVLIWTIEQLKELYPEQSPVDLILDEDCYKDRNFNDEISIYIPIQVDNQIYIFDYKCDSKKEESIDIDLETENVKFSKFMRTHNYSEYYKIIQSYSLSSFEKIGLNKINIEVSSDCYLYPEALTERIYTCEQFKGKIHLNNGEDSIEVEINENQYNQLSTLLTNAANQDKDIKQFLKENEELMIQILGEEYYRYIEITQSFTYVKKPV